MLSFAAIDVLLERLGLGSAPFPFEIPHHGRTFDERAGIRAAVIASLAGRSLAGEAESAVALFARPHTEITLFGALDDDVRLFARVCRTDQRALRAVGKPNTVQFEHIRPTAIVSSAVELLPAERPGPGQSVTISAGSVGAHEGGVARAVQAQDPQLAKARTILERKRLRLGQFRITVAGRHEPDIFWFDTPVGRYVLTSREADDGQTWATISPADSGRIAQLLTAQLDSLTGTTAAR